MFQIRDGGGGRPGRFSGKGVLYIAQCSGQPRRISFIGTRASMTPEQGAAYADGCRRRAAGR